MSLPFRREEVDTTIWNVCFKSIEEKKRSSKESNPCRPLPRTRGSRQATLWCQNGVSPMQSTSQFNPIQTELLHAMDSYLQQNDGNQLSLAGAGEDRDGLNFVPDYKIQYFLWTVLRTSNIVATFSLNKTIPLEEAVAKLRNAEYNPKVRCLVNFLIKLAFWCPHCTNSRSEVYGSYF